MHLHYRSDNDRPNKCGTPSPIITPFQTVVDGFLTAYFVIL